MGRFAEAKGLLAALKRYAATEKGKHDFQDYARAGLIMAAAMAAALGLVYFFSS